MNEKDVRLAAFCREQGCDGVLLRRRANIAWITDGADVHCDTASALGVAAVLWTPREKRVFTDNIEEPRLRAEEFGDEWELRVGSWWEPPPVDWPRSLGGERDDARFAKDWPCDTLAPLRASLTAREIERVRMLGRDTAEVVERLLKDDVRPGMTERHLGGAVAGWLRDRGIFAHVILVAADERIARFRHPIPTARAIERVAMVAVCAQRHGLIVSVTRLVSFGPLSRDLRERHDAVCRVDASLHAATQPGARWCDVLAKGIESYAATGFADEWCRHHQGGPMGYEARDFKATPTETRRVAPRQLVGWNPTITGTKSEDTILTGAGDAPSGSSAPAAQSRGPEIATATGGWPLCAGRPDILVR
ncbi:MAG: M24 family metallopeptidase [Phycisphaerae bacterium]